MCLDEDNYFFSFLTLHFFTWTIDLGRNNLSFKIFPYFIYSIINMEIIMAELEGRQMRIIQI